MQVINVNACLILKNASTHNSNTIKYYIVLFMFLQVTNEIVEC